MNDQFILFPLNKLISIGYSREYLTERFKEFKSHDEQDVVDYLSNRALDDEESHRSRTYLFLDEVEFRYGNVKIAGMFTLSVEFYHSEVDKDSNQDEITLIPAFMILQFAKHDDFKDRLDGKDMMYEIESILREVSMDIGGNDIFLECKKDKKSLMESYIKKGFLPLEGVGSQPDLIRMHKTLH